MQRRALVFSQWTDQLDLIQIYLEEGLKLTCDRYDGKQSKTARERVVETWKTPKNRHGLASVLLLTYASGAVALTLNAASCCVCFDATWNPSVDEQAAFRCYRLGQTRDVEVVRLVTPDTVDAMVMARQLPKRMYSNGAYGHGAANRGKRGLNEKSAHETCREMDALFGASNLLRFTGQ
jgi:SNF2 family DNA or RNA helicase